MKMPATPGKGGGKRPGAGRKAGTAWAPKRPQEVSRLARATTLQVLAEGRDPLLAVLQMAEDPSKDDDLRLRAYAIALPYCRPRLSMQVTADVSPKDSEPKVSQEQLFDRMLKTLDRLAPPKPRELQTIEADLPKVAVAGPDPEL